MNGILVAEIDTYCDDSPERAEQTLNPPEEPLRFGLSAKKPPGSCFLGRHGRAIPPRTSAPRILFVVKLEASEALVEIRVPSGSAPVGASRLPRGCRCGGGLEGGRRPIETVLAA